MTVAGFPVAALLFGALMRLLAMFMQFLAGLDRVQSLSHQSRPRPRLFFVREAVEYRQLRSMPGFLDMEPDNTTPGPYCFIPSNSAVNPPLPTCTSGLTTVGPRFSGQVP